MTLQTGGLLKYGPIRGEGAANATPWLIAASEQFRLKSGRFVTKGTSGPAEVADDGDTLLLGWIDPDNGEVLSVSGDYGNLIPAMGDQTIYRIPILAGTYVATMQGKTCDLVRATVAGVTLVQGAKLDGSGEDVLYIVDGDLSGNNEWVDVQVNQDKVTSLTGVV